MEAIKDPGSGFYNQEEIITSRTSWERFLFKFQINSVPHQITTAQKNIKILATLWADLFLTARSYATDGGR